MNKDQDETCATNKDLQSLCRPASLPAHSCDAVVLAWRADRLPRVPGAGR